MPKAILTHHPKIALKKKKKRISTYFCEFHACLIELTLDYDILRLFDPWNQNMEVAEEKKLKALSSRNRLILTELTSSTDAVLPDGANLQIPEGSPCSDGVRQNGIYAGECEFLLCY